MNSSSNGQRQRFQLSILASVTLALSGCYGDGLDFSDSSGGDSSGSNSPGGDSLQGTLAAPSAPTAQTQTMQLMSANAVRTQQSDCANVPSGYDALTDAEVVVLNAEGNRYDPNITAQSDECGVFEINDIPEDAGSIEAKADGFRPLQASVQSFQNEEEDNNVASTIPDTAEYRIGSLQRQDDGRLGLTVVDTETNRAVIGIPSSAFSFNVEGASIASDETSVSTAASTAEEASVSLVMDASGSMSRTAYEDPDTGERVSRFDAARLAAHQFLDDKSQRDEVSFIIFDSATDLINDQWIQDNWELATSTQSDVDYTFSPSGFSTSADDLRLIADAFSPNSELYDGAVPLHPETTTPSDLSIISSSSWSRHKWGGGTALFDSVIEGIDAVDQRQSPRKIVVTLGDGGDNSSRADEQTVADQANDNGVTVYSIGLGLGDPEERWNLGAQALQSIAEGTGGTYFGVEGGDLAQAFESIQTGILFQYIADLGQNAPAQGETVDVTLDYNGLTESRTLNAPQQQ